MNPSKAQAIKLSKKGYETLIKSLENPPKPNKVLMDAAKRYSLRTMK